MQRLGQPERSFRDWPWRIFVYNTLILYGLGFSLGAVVNLWMQHLGRTEGNAFTQRFDLVVGMALSVFGLSVVAAIQYWRRAPFLWACCASTFIAGGNLTFGLFYGLLGAISVLIASKLRDASMYWFGTGKAEEASEQEDSD